MASPSAGSAWHGLGEGCINGGHFTMCDLGLNMSVVVYPRMDECASVKQTNPTDLTSGLHDLMRTPTVMQYVDIPDPSGHFLVVSCVQKGGSYG